MPSHTTIPSAIGNGHTGTEKSKQISAFRIGTKTTNKHNFQDRCTYCAWKQSRSRWAHNWFVFFFSSFIDSTRLVCFIREPFIGIRYVWLCANGPSIWFVCVQIFLSVLFRFVVVEYVPFRYFWMHSLMTATARDRDLHDWGRKWASNVYQLRCTWISNETNGKTIERYKNHTRIERIHTETMEERKIWDRSKI